MREKYKRFYLNAGANELQRDLGWSPKLIIEKHDGEGVTAAEILSVSGIYASREGAIGAALKHGKEEIDRGFQLDCPVEK